MISQIIVLVVYVTQFIDTIYSIIIYFTISYLFIWYWPFKMPLYVSMSILYFVLPGAEKLNNQSKTLYVCQGKLFYLYFQIQGTKN